MSDNDVCGGETASMLNFSKRIAYIQLITQHIGSALYVFAGRDLHCFSIALKKYRSRFKDNSN